MHVTNPQLPKILCLHGGGTSSSIFKIQTLKLSHHLRHHFRLVFIDAPLPSPPGPGVLPVFEGSAPFHRWARVPLDGEPDVSLEEQEEEETLRCKLVEDILRRQDDEDGPFVGIMAFSQGTKVATTLLMRHGTIVNERGTIVMNLQFGILLNANFPALPMDRWSSLAVSGLRSEGWDGNGHEKLNVGGLRTDVILLPTVHVHGLSDSFLQDGRMLLDTYYERKRALLLEFDGAHHLPSSVRDTMRLVNMILQVSQNYREALKRKVDSYTDPVDI